METMLSLDKARDQWSGFGMAETAGVVTGNCGTIPLLSWRHCLPCRSPAVSSYLPYSSWTFQLSSHLISPQSLMHLAIRFLQFSAPLASVTLSLFWFVTHLSAVASTPSLAFPLSFSQIMVFPGSWRWPASPRFAWSSLFASCHR